MQRSFHWSTLHLSFCWLGNFDRIVTQKICEQRKDQRAKVSGAHRRGLVQEERLKPEHRKSVQANITVCMHSSMTVCAEAQQIQVQEGTY